MFSNLWWASLAYYGAAIVSAVVPWVNAELLMISAIPLADSRVELAALIVAVSAGQMTGKAFMYWASRKSTRPYSPMVQRAVDRGRARLDHNPRSVLATVFLSALVGFPPFFIVAVAAGALGLAFRRFLAVGVAGRLVHFAIVAYLPDLFWRMS